MGRQRREFGPEYKDEAVKLVINTGRTVAVVARELGIQEGREGDLGTYGPRRKIDDVHGPGSADEVTLLTTASDHRAVVARRPDHL